MKRFIFVLTFFICLLSPLCAEKLETNVVKSQNDFYSKGIGLRGAMLPHTGIAGISYQQWLKNNLGFQASAAFVINDYTTFYSFEAQLQKLFCVYDFGKYSTSHFFGWANLGLNSLEKEFELPDGGYEYKSIPNFFAGIGFGFGIDFFKHISMPIQFGFAVEFPTHVTFGITAGISLLYRF